MFLAETYLKMWMVLLGMGKSCLNKFKNSPVKLEDIVQKTTFISDTNCKVQRFNNSLALTENFNNHGYSLLQ